MAVAITLNNVKRVAATGHIYLQFSDGTELEFANLAEIQAWANEIDLDLAQARSLLKKVLGRWYFIRDPSGATPSLVNGKTITLDLAAAANLLTVG